MHASVAGQRRRAVVPASLALSVVLAAAGVAGLATASDLEFVEAQVNGVAGVTGLQHASSCSVSEDGSSVYVSANQSHAVVQFDRDAVTGGLSFVAAYVNDTGGVEGLVNCMGVAVSPDGANVYTAAQTSDAIAVFSRDPANGDLTWLEAHYDGVAGVDGLDRIMHVLVSPDGRNVYACAINDRSVAVFSRDVTTGALTFMEVHVHGVGGVEYLNSPIRLAMDRQGTHLYAAAMWSDAVAVFARNPATGSLTYAGAFTDSDLQGCRDVVVAPDGRFVYVTGPFANALMVLERNPVTGLLSHVETYSDGVGGISGMAGAGGLMMDPWGLFVTVLGRDGDSIAVFRRNPADGRLVFAGAEFDGVNDVEGLATPEYGCVDAQGRSVYVAAWDDDAVSAFATRRLLGDGFEAGDTAQWSTTTP